MQRRHVTGAVIGTLHIVRALLQVVLWVLISVAEYCSTASSAAEHQAMHFTISHGCLSFESPAHTDVNIAQTAVRL